MSKLPTWVNLYGNYPLKKVDEVFKQIGGKAEQNFDSGFFENACTFRVSSSLNGANGMHKIPFFKDISNHNGKMEAQVSSGKDKNWYVIRVTMLVKYLTRTYRKPEVLKPGSYKQAIKDRKGIIVYVQPLGNATGHADLWDGYGAIWSEFNGADKIYFWEAGK
jgi:hypothetical protein